MSDWLDAERHAELAHQFYEAGQWDKALAELKLALSVNPNQSEWHLGMGLTLDAMHRHEEAIACFEETIRLRGPDAETLLHLGVNLIRIDQPKRAVEVLESAAQLDPEHEPAYCHRIQAYAHLGNHDEAEAMFYLARQIVEECPLCYDHLAQSLAMRGELDRAIWCWQQTLKLEPNYGGVYASLGRAHWHKGQLDQARGLFVKQLRQEPGDIDVLLELGELLIQMGRVAEAAEKFRRVLELDPEVAQAHLHLGELAMMSGHLESAEGELDEAGRLDSDLPGVALCQAQVAQRRNRNAEARKLLTAELERQGHSPHQALELGRMLIEVRMLEQADRWLTALLDSPQGKTLDDDRLSTARLYRGVARMFAGKLTEGIRDCRMSLRLSPKNSLAMHNLAVAYVEVGRLDRAKLWMRRAMALRPHDPDLVRVRRRLLVRRFTSVFRRAWRAVRGQTHK